MTARLVMKVGRDVREIPIGSEPVVIGRAEECTITILDPKSSRKHCSVVAQEGRYSVVDHDSRNGTTLNGQKVARQIVRDGDVIAIGNTTFIFHGESGGEADEAGAPAPASEKWVLQMETPDGQTRTFDLIDKVTIGRNPKNVISIQDTKASNFHCEVLREGPGYLVRDLNSTNGTRVDGKLIEELDLYHGSVISIGKTHFTIRNLAIPDAETGFESGPVGGPEFATFRRKRRGFPIGLLLMVVVLGGALYLVNMVAVKQVKVAGIQNPAGNLLPKNYSFEGMLDSRSFPIGFRALHSDTDMVTVAEGAARTGKKSLVVEKGEPGEGEKEGGVVEVIYGKEIALTPGKVYALSAWVLPADLVGICGVKLVWLNRKDPTYRIESYSNLVSGEASDFTEAKVQAAIPLGATVVEAVCFVKARSGAAYIDDLQLHVTSEPDALTLVGDRLTIKVTPAGVFSIQRKGGSTDLLRDGQLILLGEGRKAWQRYCRTLEGFPKQSSEGIEIEGEILDFTSGQWIPFKEVLTLSGGQLGIAYEVDGAFEAVSLGAGIAFTPLPEETAAGVGIVTPDAYGMMRGGFEADGVSRMLWGQSTRPFSFNYDPPVNCFHVREEEQLFLLQYIQNPGEGKKLRLSVSVQTNFNALNTEIRSALSIAREAEKEGKPGVAIAALNPIVTKYPFIRTESKSDLGPRDERTAKEWLDRLERGAFEKAEKIRTRFEVAQFFRNLREMEASLGDATSFLEKYSGSSEEKDIRDLADRITSAIRDQRIRAGQQEAAGFLLRAREHRDRKEQALAKLLYRHVIDTWPGTEWAKTAEEEEKALEGK
ncbi:MAG: FHA domain-containing protein [Planctomycetota bacterium]|jgi:pSer/pThr/pTyr-binding forkhead associated (FHA) protein